MRYKIVMEAYIGEDIIMEHNLTKEEAEAKIKEYEEKDSIHYYAIKEEE